MVQEIWTARHARQLDRARARELSRKLVTAAARDVEKHASYEPAFDIRLSWALEVLDQTRGGTSYPRADSASEAAVAFMLRRETDVIEESLPRLCGKDLSAGMRD